jgi:hypothetical protein
MSKMRIGRVSYGTLLPAFLAFAIMACGGGGSSGAGGGGGGGGGGATGSGPLSFYQNYNLVAYVDVQGTFTNVQRERISAFGGVPGAAGYTWSRTLGAGLPSTITIDAATGLLGGTLPSNFAPGAPGVSAGGGTYYYDLTVTVSDGTSSISSAPGAIRLFVYPCNSLVGGSNAWSCSGGIGHTPYPYGSPWQAGDGFSAGTPLDITWDMGLTGIKVNQPFGYTLPFGGGTPPYTFAVSGALPPGLSLSTTTGTILGTPTAAAIGNTYEFSVTITDHLGNQDVGYYSMSDFRT